MGRGRAGGHILTWIILILQNADITPIQGRASSTTGHYRELVHRLVCKTNIPGEIGTAKIATLIVKFSTING